jgi:hypothetical protein
MFLEQRAVSPKTCHTPSSVIQARFRFPVSRFEFFAAAPAHDRGILQQRSGNSASILLASEFQFLNS